MVPPQSRENSHEFPSFNNIELYKCFLSLVYGGGLRAHFLSVHHVPYKFMSLNHCAHLPSQKTAVFQLI